MNSSNLYPDLDVRKVANIFYLQKSIVITVFLVVFEIGRASCRERVYVLV